MKILLDACVPRPLRRFFPDHEVRTAQEMGWGQLKNGALLGEAEAVFDLFISSDRNLRYQQQIAGRRIAILILSTNDWPRIRAKTGEIFACTTSLKAGDFLELDLG